jgi:hypothetical protein
MDVSGAAVAEVAREAIQHVERWLRLRTTWIA